MSKTIEDLNKAVKRFLINNTNIVNLVPGSPSIGDNLMAEIDAGIMEAANNARIHAERLHDFSSNETSGRAVLTFGAPINLDRVPVKRFFSGASSKTVDAAIGIESSLTDWPELTLPTEDGASVDVSGVEMVSFGGDVHAPLVAGTLYTVINARVNPDLTTTLTLGIAPGQSLSIEGSSVIFHTAQFKRFKTVQSAWLAQGLAHRPLKIQRLQSKMIEMMRARDRSITEWTRDPVTSEPNTEFECVIRGRELHVQPTSDSVEIAVTGNVWMEPYTELTDTDFLLQNGFDFMMWQTIIEMNFAVLKFVTRQEGTMAPPTQARDVAWESLVLWDSHSIDGNIYHDL